MPNRGEDGRIMLEVLRELPPGMGTALIRFYVLGHDIDEICADLGITSSEFHRAKTTAKTQFEQRISASGSKEQLQRQTLY